MYRPVSLVTLKNASLEVRVNPQVGGAVTDIHHVATGLSVLGRTPWDAIDAPIDSYAARDEPEWLTRYTGGWPLLFPNAGDACEVDGVFHGFHGEASIAPWQAEMEDGSLILSRTFVSLPAVMRRTMTLSGETLTIREELHHSGTQPIDVMWGHHPTFGSDLLAGPFEVTCGASEVRAEAQNDPPFNPLRPGVSGRWPSPLGKHGIVDLSHPKAPWASVAYLEDFASPWAAIRRMDNAIAVCLTWDGALYPTAWLWYELEATAEAPWGGDTRLIGIEPNTTACALGLGTAKARGARLLRLTPGSKVKATIALHVFKPSGPVLTRPRGMPEDVTEQAMSS